MRADQWLILGVAGLGAFALYRLASASNASRPSLPGDDREPITPRIPTGSLPERPGPAPAPPGVVSAIAGNQLSLANSRAYRGRLETIDAAGRANPFPFSPNATSDQLAATLESLGFDGARAFLTPEDATAGGFAPWAIANAGRGTRWFYGRWTQPAMQVGLPPGVVNVWVSQPFGRPDVPSTLIDPRLMQFARR